MAPTDPDDLAPGYVVYGDGTTVAKMKRSQWVLRIRIRNSFEKVMLYYTRLQDLINEVGFENLLLEFTQEGE